MLKDEQGFGAIQQIKDKAPNVAVVVVSGAEDGATIRACRPDSLCPNTSPSTWQR